MSMNVASVLLIELHRFLRPLYNVAYGRDVLGETRRLLRGCGWQVTVDLDPDDIIGIIDPVVALIENTMADPIPDDLFEAVALIEQVTSLVNDLRGIGENLAALGSAQPPTPEAVAALAEDLAHHLAIRWLSTKGDVLGLTDTFGFTAQVDVDEMTLTWLKRPAGTQHRVQPAVLADLLRDPAGFVLDRIAPTRWESDDHVKATMLLVANIITPLVRPRGWQVPLRGRRYIPDPRDVADQLLYPALEITLPTGQGGLQATLAVDVEVASADGTLPSGASGPGLALTPRGSINTGFDIAGFVMSANAELDTDGRAIEINRDGVSFDPDIAVSVDFGLKKDLNLILGVGRTGLTLGTLEFNATANASANDTAEFTVEVLARDSRAGISTQDFGSAVAKVLPLDVEVPFDLGLIWSSATGLTLSGSASLDIVISNEISFADGMFVLRNMRLGVEIGEDGDPGIGLSVSGDVDFTLEVLQATIEGIGLMTEITFPPEGGNLGKGHLRFGIDPPERLGLSLNFPAVSGGGFIGIDHEIGRYSGALSIKVVEVGISAIIVIDTQLPGDPNGWAFFAALSLEFPEIPLGYGFTLSGLGGLVALNRGIDTQSIASGLKSGVVDALLFPDDPVGDSAMLIAMIDDYFPILPGNVVIGPIVQIGWGVPTTLITAQLGIVISLPEGKIVLLGSISALLPDPDAPVLELRLDLVGEIDFPAGTLFMQASLYDSRLLGIIELSGDMGMFLAVSGQKYFLMSVGGYHPGFQPPALVPETLHNLTRMSAAISLADNVSVTLTTYFAVTSNTVQFGSAVDLVASVKVAFKTYRAIGYFGFNVLLRFSPFAVIADFAAGVGVYSGNKELMGVHFEAYLEGPDPWYVTGQASFKFFGIKVKFNVEVGSQVGSEPKEAVELRDKVREALAAASAWSEIAPTITVSGITYIDVSDEDIAWIRPDHLVEVAQGVAPLNREIEVVGQGLPAAGDNRFTITDAGLRGSTAPWETKTDWFAPAQFERMSNDEKLARASFEQMDAGVSFGGGTLATTPNAAALGREATLDFEDVLYENTPATVLKLETGYILNAAQSGLASLQMAGVEQATAPAFTVLEPVFSVINDVDATLQNQTAAVAVSQYEALSQAQGGTGRVALAASAMEAA